jgi:hypothetical protein
VPRVLLLASALALALAPLSARALEPRFDHRDSHGPLLEFLLAHDTVVAGGNTTHSWRPALRAGWGFDVTGEGSELIASADVALRSFDDPARERILVSTSLRYRGYFGTEEWKTFFDAGAWVPLRSRLGIGPLVGVGVIHDFSQDAGLFASAQFATAIGDGRVVSFGGLAGFQFRFAIP